MKKIILVLTLLIVHCTFVIDNCDAQVWSPIGDGFSGWVSSNSGPIVWAMISYNNEIIAGGDFDSAGGNPAKCIAKWNGTSWMPMGSGFNWPVSSFAVYNNELIVAGTLDDYEVTKWNGTNWVGIGTTYNACAVEVILVYNNELIAAGGFLNLSGVSVNRIAKWNGTTWSPLGSGTSGGFSPVITSLAVYNNELIAAGRFTSAGGINANNIAKWNGTNWSPLGTGIHLLNSTSGVQSLTVFNNELIVGGMWFDSAGGIAVKNIAKWNGTNWSGLGSGTNSGVIDLTVFNNELIAGGYFTIAGGVNVNYIAKWNGTSWSPLGSGVSEGFNGNPTVNSLFSYNGNLFTGGAFKKAGGILSNSIAKWGPAYSVTGQVRYADNNQPATGGYVKAIKPDKLSGGIITFDSVQIQPNGNYSLTNVPQDSVDIGVYPNSSTQNDWVMTYYPSTIYWQNATTIYPTGNLTNINVGVYRLSSTTNNNSVNGKVMRLNDSPSLANLKDAVLYAKSGNTFVRCGISDANGVYHLPSLPAGSLKIICNRLGFTGDSTTVNVTSTSNIDSINFYLYKLPIGIKQLGSEVPSEYKLYQNYPNPFNPTTNIRYQIPFHGGSSTNNKLVTLKVYDLLGKEVVTLVNENQSPGVYEVTFDAGSLPSGVYFYKLQSGDFTEVKKMLLIK